MRDLAEHVTQFRSRVLQDALTEATASYWERRANQFSAAAPRPGDWHGNATRAELQERFDRCHATAAACRRHAQLLREGRADQPLSSEVLCALSEMA